jgi:hypothetical protein
VRSSKNRCVKLAAEVQVYSDPASTLRTMAHNHSASQDVGLNAIQQTSGKPQSPTLMDLDIQDRGYHLLRISLLGTSVNKPIMHLASRLPRSNSFRGCIEAYKLVYSG